MRGKEGAQGLHDRSEEQTWIGKHPGPAGGVKLRQGRSKTQAVPGHEPSITDTEPQCALETNSPDVRRVHNGITVRTCVCLRHRRLPPPATAAKREQRPLAVMPQQPLAATHSNWRPRRPAGQPLQQRAGCRRPADLNLRRRHVPMRRRVGSCPVRCGVLRCGGGLCVGGGVGGCGGRGNGSGAASGRDGGGGAEGAAAEHVVREAVCMRRGKRGVQVAQACSMGSLAGVTRPAARYRAPARLVPAERVRTTRNSGLRFVRGPPQPPRACTPPVYATHVCNLIAPNP